MHRADRQRRAMRLRPTRTIGIEGRISAVMAAVHGCDHSVRRERRASEETAEPVDRRLHREHAGDARSQPASPQYYRPRLLRTLAVQVYTRGKSPGLTR